MLELAAGTIVAGKYRITGVLGAGAMGVVYRAEQLDAEGRGLREVALKTMQPSLSADANFAKRFLREVRIAASLSSPYVVTVYDAGRTDDGALYFTMELVRGKTLRELLDQAGRLPVRRAIGVVGQICEALVEAHGAGEAIVHRDLKPANIFVVERRGEDRVKVNDFGIAKVIGEETSSLTTGGSSPGTPRYMPPEQWRGEAMDGRADLYALGVIFFECLGGATPFSGAIETLMYKHLNEPPPPLPSSIPAPLRELVVRMLAKRPEDRPRDVLEVKRILDDVESQLTEEQEAATTVPMAVAAASAQDVTRPLPDAAPPRVAAPPAAAPGPRPGVSASKLGLYALASIVALAALVGVVLWVSSPGPTIVAEPTAEPTAASLPTVRAVPTAPPARPADTPRPQPTAVPPTPVPAAPTAVPVAVVSTRAPEPSPADEAKDCDRAPLSDGEAKTWVESYRRALVAKDIAKLRELGAVRSPDEADKVKRRLEPLRDLAIDIDDLEIRTEGARGEVSFSVSKRWRDARQPTTVFDFDAERRVLGRSNCRVVALP